MPEIRTSGLYRIALTPHCANPDGRQEVFFQSRGVDLPKSSTAVERRLWPHRRLQYRHTEAAGEKAMDTVETAMSAHCPEQIEGLTMSTSRHMKAVAMERTATQHAGQPRSM